ncbi:hypothetical protein M5689_005578 [Euphorbia peplus]|nr:hypothetical protein M5689_005578 [Euphorbia peplus]
MEKKNIMVDISCFTVIEGSADSELLKVCNDVIMRCDDNDDAESCSCDSNNGLGFVDVFECEDEDDQEIQDHTHNCKKNQKWTSGKRWVEDDDDVGSDEAESKLGSRKIVDQMDDSLFWETCMAVGYP